LLFVFILKICNGRTPSGTDLSSPPAVQPSDYTTSHYLRRTNAETVIVFVHGVFGGGIGTWKNPETGAYWPQLLADDKSFGNSDIYVYSYPTPYLSQSYTIDELIENMRLVFANDEVFTKHVRVVFLCHSMGGLIVRGFLKRYQVNAPKVPLIYFFSTPTAGAHIAGLAHFLTRNPQLRGVLPADSEDYVSNLQRDWRALPIRVNSRCAYEKQDTYGVRIVDEQSASALCDGPVDPINANHISIVKPRDSQDLPYLAFRQAFLDSRSVNPSAENPVPPTEQPATGLVQAGRSVEVDCGQVRDATALIPPPIEIKPQQKIFDALASLQEASNLKEQRVEANGVVNQMARVHYRLVGLDRPADGSCPVKGYGVILVTFLVTQPKSMRAVGLTPIKRDSLILSLLGKSGTVSIKNAKNIPAVDSHVGEHVAINPDDVKIKGTGISYVGTHSGIGTGAAIEPDAIQREALRNSPGRTSPGRAAHSSPPSTAATPHQ